MSFTCQKGEFDWFFNRLDRPVKESWPDRPVNPTDFHLWFEYYKDQNENFPAQNQVRFPAQN